MLIIFSGILTQNSAVTGRMKTENLANLFFRTNFQSLNARITQMETWFPQARVNHISFTSPLRIKLTIGDGLGYLNRAVMKSQQCILMLNHSCLRFPKSFNKTLQRPLQMIPQSLRQICQKDME